MESAETIADGPVTVAVTPPRRSAFRDVPWGRGDVLIGIAPLVLVEGFPRLMPPWIISAFPIWLRLLLPLLSFSWMGLYPLWVCRRHGRLPRIPRPRVVLVEALIALIAAPVLLVTMAATTQLLVGLSGGSAMPPSPFEPVARSSDRLGLWFLLILGVSAAPITEEIFFRGMIYNALRQRFHPAGAILLQAAMFGFSHPFELVYSTAVVIGAILLALIYEWRKTLLTTILLHAMQNAAGLAVLAATAAAYAAAPLLGVYGTAAERGCEVTAVVPGSAADVAGLRVGDVITAVGGQPVADTPGIARTLLGRRAGDAVEVQLVRDGEAHRLEATLKKRQD